MLLTVRNGPLAATVAGKEEFDAPSIILMATSCTTRKDEVLNFVLIFVLKFEKEAGMTHCVLVMMQSA